MIKFASVVTLASIVIPTNMFVYGTSDTNYVDTVSSTIEVSKLQSNNSNNEEGDSGDDKVIVSSDIAKVLGLDYAKDDCKSIILGDELLESNIVLMSDESKKSLENKYSGLQGVKSAELGDYDVLDLTVSVDTDVDAKKTRTLVTKKAVKSYSGPGDKYKVVDEYRQNIKISVTTVEKNGYVMLDNNGFDEWIKRDDLCTQDEYNKSLQGKALLDIDNPDTSYVGRSVSLTEDDRDLLERLVMGEAGAEGYEGAALVAQCIRDTMVYKGYSSVASVRTGCKYSGSIAKAPNQNVKDAVAFIFDQGGYAVRHKIFYFYAPQYCSSAWHESQPFVIEHGGHRFFASR